MGVASFNRTLDQELAAIARGASYECLVCGEFLLRGPSRTPASSAARSSATASQSRNPS